jgi:hypothetical protein
VYQTNLKKIVKNVKNNDLCVNLRWKMGEKDISIEKAILLNLKDGWKDKFQC